MRLLAGKLDESYDAGGMESFPPCLVAVDISVHPQCFGFSQHPCFEFLQVQLLARAVLHANQMRLWQRLMKASHLHPAGAFVLCSSNIAGAELLRTWLCQCR